MGNLEKCLVLTWLSNLCLILRHLKGYKRQKIISLIKLNKWIRIWTSKTLLRWWEICKWELKATQEWLKDRWCHNECQMDRWWVLEWTSNFLKDHIKECPRCKDTHKCSRTIKCTLSRTLKSCQDRWEWAKVANTGSSSLRSRCSSNKTSKTIKDSRISHRLLN